MSVGVEIRRLLAFAALGTFVTLTWSGMLVEPSPARVAAGLLPVVAAALLIPLRRSPLGTVPAGIVAALLIVLATALGIVAAGLPARLLPPGGWGELWSGVDLGFAGLGDGVHYPYEGPNDWARLLILAGAPLALGISALLTFLPLRREPTEPRLAGLAVLIVAYAVAATMYEPEHAVLRGVVLLLGVIAWIWLPSLERRVALSATALVALAVVAAIPLTTRLEDTEALVNYRSWDWATGPGTAFDWDHGYGPIDWERSDDTVMVVESRTPNYWKADVLDRFDGRGWVRSGLVHPPLEVPVAVEGQSASAGFERDWVTTARVTVDDLRSDLVVGPGTGRRVLGGVVSRPSADNAIVHSVEPLSKGDSYEIRGYAPDPGAAEMRAAGSDVPPRLEPFTAIHVPEEAGGSVIRVDTRGILTGQAERARELIARSPYGRMAALAARLTADAPTSYDAVKRIESHLLTNYRYSETPPERPLPLESFLFEDRIGYCQQFSGAMTLMLRMRGIPARVATGFSPGVPDGDGRFVVRALDAHSWVEVYFAGIGWVPFDPTPAAAPAELRNGGSTAASSAASSLGPLLLGASAFGFGDGVGGRGARPRRGGGAELSNSRPSTDPEGSSGLPLPLLGLLIVTGLAAVGPGLRRRRRERKLGTEAAVEVRVAELERALRRLRFRHRHGATLLEVERALRSRAEPGAAGYVARLRRLRYERDPAGGPPSGAERRALRRRLTEGGGLSARVAAWLAIPPLSPKR